jgi:hypothetical protein
MSWSALQRERTRKINTLGRSGASPRQRAKPDAHDLRAPTPSSARMGWTLWTARRAYGFSTHRMAIRWMFRDCALHQAAYDRSMGNPRPQRSLGVLLVLTCAGLPLANAKPIAFAHGTTVMAEYGAGTMREAQLFYAPRYFWSVGLGHLALDSDIDDRSRDVTYARVNYLVKRWNMESAQANIFTWGSLGRATTGDDGQGRFAWSAGGQLDYETRRVYASLKSDYYDASTSTHRIDTVQLGFAPYEHDYSTLATWFVLQARHYTGGIYDGTEVAFLLRLFKRGAWLEAGPTTDGKIQAMLMFNF